MIYTSPNISGKESKRRRRSVLLTPFIVRLPNRYTVGRSIAPRNQRPLSLVIFSQFCSQISAQREACLLLNKTQQDICAARKRQDQVSLICVVPTSTRFTCASYEFPCLWVRHTTRIFFDLEEENKEETRLSSFFMNLLAQCRYHSRAATILRLNCRCPTFSDDSYAEVNLQAS